MLSLSQGLQHLLPWEHPLGSPCPLSSCILCCAAPSWGSLSKGSLHVLPSVCFQGNVAGQQHRLGLLWKFGSVSPPGCSSSSSSSGSAGAGGSLGMRLESRVSVILAVCTGLGEKQMQSGPNKPKSIRDVLSLV